MNSIDVVPPGSPVLVGEIPARIVEVCIGTSLSPEYLLHWWDGRSLQAARFDRDQFLLVDDRPKLTIGFGRGA